MENFEIKKADEELRKKILAELAPFASSSPEERNKRIESARDNLESFALTYFPHHLHDKPSQMHHELYAKYAKLIDRAEKNGTGSKDCNAAPRGNAKSTLTTLILPLWCIAFKKRKFIGVLSDTTEQAQEFIDGIKAELEVNERLREDFPKACGEGRRWRVGEIVTSNSIKVKGWGKGKRIRGARFGSRRPDLIICDDLESDENIASPEQREKDRNWFFKAVMKAGAKYSVFIVVGTILHYDSLLARLLDQPGWSAKKYKAVIDWSVSPLWQVWEGVLSEKGEESADIFFEKHKKEMLKGTRVLWPEGEPYYYLMKMRYTDGPAYFDSEKQNEPINPEDRLFNEEWFAYVEEEEFLSRLRNGLYTEVFASVDPSMGGKSSKADPSAIVVLGKLPDGLLDVLEADIQKRHPDKIMERVFELNDIYRFTRLVIEEVQFQELFKDNMLTESAKRGVYLPVEGTRPVTDKVLRITKLQPHIKNRFIRFRRNQSLLLNQLKYFPKADHDDGPDALEMAFQLASSGTNAPRIRSLA